jgi:fructokinase
VTALVIGEALIDVVDTPGRPLQRTPGGGPFNVAIGLARLQIPTALLSCVGADTDGDLLLSALVPRNPAMRDQPPQVQASFAEAA